MSGHNNLGLRKGSIRCEFYYVLFYSTGLFAFISNYFRYCDYSVCQHSEGNEGEQNQGWGIGVLYSWVTGWRDLGCFSSFKLWSPYLLLSFFSSSFHSFYPRHLVLQLIFISLRSLIL